MDAKLNLGELLYDIDCIATSHSFDAKALLTMKQGDILMPEDGLNIEAQLYINSEFLCNCELAYYGDDLKAKVFMKRSLYAD